MDIPLTQQATTCRFGRVEEYPRTIKEFERRFSSEKACRAYIEAFA